MPSSVTPRRQQLVDAVTQRREGGGLGQRVELLDAQPAAGELVDRMLRRQPLARALVGIVELAAELLEERARLRGQ